METKKQCADMTYLGHRAFQALLSFIAELDRCVACDYRQGSVPAGSGVEKQLLATHRLLESCGKRLSYLRSDSAGYMADAINTCNDLGVTFTITADQDAAVVKIVRRLKRAERMDSALSSGRQGDRPVVQDGRSLHGEDGEGFHPARPALAQSEAGPVSP